MALSPPSKPKHLALQQKGQSPLLNFGVPPVTVDPPPNRAPATPGISVRLDAAPDSPGGNTSPRALPYLVYHNASVSSITQTDSPTVSVSYDMPVSPGVPAAGPCKSDKSEKPTVSVCFEVPDKSEDPAVSVDFDVPASTSVIPASPCVLDKSENPIISVSSDEPASINFPSASPCDQDKTDNPIVSVSYEVPVSTSNPTASTRVPVKADNLAISVSSDDERASTSVPPASSCASHKRDNPAVSVPSDVPVSTNMSQASPRVPDKSDNPAISVSSEDPASTGVPPASRCVPDNTTDSISLDAPASPDDPLAIPSLHPTSSAPVDASDVPVLQRCEDIPKSESDKREYRALVLSNQMKVMLVSDRSAETSAAALQVNVGYCSDPDELPGLAHFCEHMLFLGTDKYPEENEYGKYLSEHGGYSNACTGRDYTKFYFSVLPEHLGQSLDIFAQFFIAPLFTESATERELNAVDSEHQNNVQSDGRRLGRVDNCAATPGHPFRKFGTGNRQTLETVPKEKGIDVRQELLRFHQRWYSSNIMALAVVGKESLDHLEAMVVPLFSSVKNSAVEPPSWPEHPFPPPLRRKRTFCEPVTDFRSLAIDFPISDYTKEHYVGRPYNYLAHLIGHEGPGSLLSALKKRGWCNSLGAGPGFSARGFGFFGISVDLTENGVEHIDDIVALAFQYIAMLRARGPLSEVWEEQGELSDLAFRFEDPSEPESLVNSLVDVLQEFPHLPMDDVLATWRVMDWRPSLIEEAISSLTPENVRLQIVAKCFAHKCSQEEPWYGVKYLEEDIEPEKIKEWESLELHPELALPPPNEFVPSRVDLEERTDLTCDAVAPEIVKDTPFMRLWYKQDNEFLLPKASIEFEFNSPLPSQSLRNYQLTDIWVMLVQDSLQESTYAAGLASLDWDLDCSVCSISVNINGFDDKQHVLLKIIMDRIVNFQPDPRRFAVMKEKLVRALKNTEKGQPYKHALFEQNSCFSERVWWTTQQHLDAIESLTVEMLVDYVPRFLRSVYVEGIAFGNLSRARALKLAEIVETRIPKDAIPVLAQDLLMPRALEIEKGAYYLRETENAVHTSSCAAVYLECGVSDIRPSLVLELLMKVLQEPCFDTLRTKEQLGYIVSSGMRRWCGVHGVTVLVQGDSHPAHLDARIDAFLLDAQEYLDSMSEEEFLRHRISLAALCSERPKQIYSKKNQMWSEIIKQTYEFDRARVEVEVLNTVSKEELIQFYKKHISPCSSERRKLSAHVVSTAEGGAGRDNTDDSDNKHQQPTRITDLIEFKSGRFLHPRPAGSTSVPQRGS